MESSPITSLYPRVQGMFQSFYLLGQVIVTSHTSSQGLLKLVKHHRKLNYGLRPSHPSLLGYEA
jgi:hypothetical protein